MIEPELEKLLEPLERFEEIRRRAARLGDRLCDLSYANPYEGARRVARAALRETLEGERMLDLQYAPFGGQTLARRAVADALRESHGLPFAFDDVVLTPGAMTALQLALRACWEPEGEVVIPVPCWLDHPLYVRFVGLRPRLVLLPAEHFDLDPEAIGQALGPRTCALILTHPANPTGRSYRPGMLRQLGDTLRRAEADFGCRVTLIADEVHRDFVAPEEYRSAADFYDRTIVVYSFGKYHYMQGQRLGYAAASPKHPERRVLGRELVRWTRITGTATPTALMQRAIPRLLALRHDQGLLDGWRERLLAGLRGAGYAVVEPDGTLFIYIRTPPEHGDDFAFVSALAARGVVVLPAQVFHHSGFFRISLTGSEEMLAQALSVLEELGPQ